MKSRLVFGAALATAGMLAVAAIVALVWRDAWIRALAVSGRYEPFRILALDALPWTLLVAALAFGGAAFLLRAPLQVPDGRVWPLAMLAAGALLWSGYRLGYEPAFEMAEDFPSYFFAAELVAQDRDPYDQAALLRQAATRLPLELSRVHERAGLPPPRTGFGARIFPYLYPPLTAVLLVPLHVLDYAAAQGIWTIANLIVLWVLLALAVSIADNRRRAVLGAAFVVLYTLGYDWFGNWTTPLTRNADTGQVNLLVVLAAWLAFRLDATGRVWAAGALLACAVHVKFSPLLLVTYFVVRGRWLTLLATTACGAALFLLTWWSVGGSALWHFFGGLDEYSWLGRLRIPVDLRPEALVLPNNPDPVSAFYTYPQIRVFNQAPLALAGMAASAAGWSGAAAVRITQLLLGIAWGVTLWRVWATRRGGETASGFAACTALVLASSPMLWQHHLVWMIVPAVLLVGSARLRKRPALAGMCVSGFVLIASHYGHRFLGQFAEPHVPFAYGELLGLFLLWAALLWLCGESAHDDPGRAMGSGSSSGLENRLPEVPV